MDDTRDSDAKRTGKLLPFIAENHQRRAPSARDVLAVVHSFNAWQRAKAERIAATPRVQPKTDRRKR